MTLNNFIKLILTVIYLFFVHYGTAQYIVEGAVYNDQKEGLPFVLIYETNNEQNNILSELDGTFSIELTSKESDITFQYIGFQTTNIPVSDKERLQVVLQQDIPFLSKVIVTASSKPTSQLRATTAIESLSTKELERFTPTSFMDYLRFTPGVNVQTNGGRSRNSIYIRGFPDASGSMVYSTQLIDGVRTFGSPMMATDGTFKPDLNVGKAEFMRGNTATLLGRGSTAGAYNFISKTGATTTNAIVEAKIGDNNWYQLDVNINGSLSKDKSWRYNAGGFLMTDDGYKNMPFPDKGGQFRVNIDKLFEQNKGQLRIYAGVIDLRVNLLRDVPYSPEDLTKPIEGWTTKDAVLQSGNGYEGQAWPITFPGGATATNRYDEWFPKNMFSKGYNVGVNLNMDLGSGFYLINKFRYQSMVFGSGLETPNNNAAVRGVNSVATFGDDQVRLLFGGGLSDGGDKTYDIIEDIRVFKTFDTGQLSHTLSLGGYASIFHNYSSINFSLYTTDSTTPQTAIDSLFIIGSVEGIYTEIFRNTNGFENTYSLYLHDEISIDEKLNIHAGIRYDYVGFDLTENKNTFEALNYRLSHTGLSFSMGANYLLHSNSAFYASFSRSYRAPDMRDYIPVITGSTPDSYLNPRVEENENINSFEIGYRKSTDEWSLDATLFSSDINNRRLADYNGDVTIQIPVGDNHIRGLECSFIYTPKRFKGLYARTTLTAQYSYYTDYTQTIQYTNPNDPDEIISEFHDFEGNELTDIPPVIWNITLGYQKEKFGFNINNNLISKRWIDPYNTLQYPVRNLMSANAYFNITKKLSLRFSSTNVLNNQGIGSIINARNAEVPTIYVAQINNFEGNFRHVSGNSLLRRRILGSIRYTF